MAEVCSSGKRGLSTFTMLTLSDMCFLSFRIQSFKKQKLSERDEKRRKMAEDLERREKMVDLKSKENTAKMKLQEQLERLRKDAADRQQNIYSRLVRDKEGDKQISERMNRTVKLNWNENEGLSFESLRDIVSDHGKIEDMVLRDAKIGKSALVVMKSADSVGSLVSSDTLSRLKIKVLPLGESLNLNNRKSEVNLHGTNERVEPKLSKNKRVFPATQSASHEMKTRATKVTELEAQVLGRLRSVAKQAGK